jgi:hypothetical protein
MSRALILLMAVPSLAVSQPARMISPAELTALEAKVAAGEATRDEEKLLGWNYAFLIDGVTAVDSHGLATATDKSLRRSPAAARARREVLASKRAAVVGATAEVLWLNCGLYSRDRRAFALKLMDRAIELAPDDPEWHRLRVIPTEYAMELGRPKLTKAEAFRQMDGDIAALRGEERIGALRSAAKTAFKVGDLAKAEAWGEEMLKAARRDEGAAYYGDAIFYGHMVLGQVALRRGEMEAARMHLLESARTPGSPTLSSFGPNTSLARDMLKAGERDVVIEFLGLTKEFWKSPYSDADRWIRTIRAGRIPDWRASERF